MDILEVKELKNTLEAYSYDMRNNLDSYGSLEKYLEDGQRAAFLKEINEVVDWLYGDGEAASKEEYKVRIDKFKKIGDPVKQRHFYYGELDLYFGQFDQISANIKSKLESIAHLTDAQKETVTKKHEEAQKFMDGVKADRAGKQLFQDPAYTLDQILTTFNLVKSETDAIFNAPPPKPKEEKKDEKMEDATEKKEGEPAPTEANGQGASPGDVPMENQE